MATASGVKARSRSGLGAQVATLSGKPSNARAAALATHVRSLASLCVLDLLLGAACCVLILVHLPAVAAAVDVAAARQSLLFLRAIRWIMGVPAGLKLNDALDYCLGNLCILGIQCYQVPPAPPRPLFVCFQNGVCAHQGVWLGLFKRIARKLGLVRFGLI